MRHQRSGLTGRLALDPSEPGAIREPVIKQRARYSLSHTVLTPWVRTWFICGFVLLLGGCSRAFWRQNADENTYSILGFKTADPRWSTPRLDVQPDPRSRFYDPYDPDCEPLPPDDPVANVYMQWMGRDAGIAKVDQPWHGGFLPHFLQPSKPLRGWKSWHRFGEALSVENPQWLEPFGLSPEQIADQKTAGMPEGPGIANLTLEQAIELSYIHSREFQTQIENLYLTALNLTFERFRFDVRWLGLGARKPSSTVTATDVPGVSDSIGSNVRAGASQLLPTGGQWVVEMANNTLWLFSAGTDASSASVLSYSLVQPLLLGAGRQVILESLTQSERDTLYSARNFYRFRQTFFVQTVSGGNSTSGAYLGLLRQLQAIRNQRYNIYLLNNQVRRLRALATERPEVMAEKLAKLPPDLVIPPKYQRIFLYDVDLKELRFQGLMTGEQYEELKPLSQDEDYQRVLAELFDRSQDTTTLTLDVTQLATQLASSTSQLLNNERAFQDALDRYKFQLGLPPDLWVTIDPSTLKPFELISPELRALEEMLTNFVEEVGKLPDENPPADQIESVRSQLAAHANRVSTEGMGLIDSDLEKVLAQHEARLQSILNEEDRTRYVDFLTRDKLLISRYKNELKGIIRDLEDVKKIPLAPAPETETEYRSPAEALFDLREKLLQIVQSLQVVQINLRVELIKLNTFELPIDQAVATGLENRVDLMNSRAQVMDFRRKIEVIANRLRSQLDLRIEGDLRTQPLGTPGPTTPFNFSGSQSSLRAGVQFTAPLDQVAERNDYRAALIDYQRARRSYMQAEDQVKLDIRAAWRQLNVLKQTFEIARLNVRLAAMQLDQAIERSTAPSTTGTSGGSGGGNSGLNLLQALNSVLSAQNNLIQIWADYETNRLNIHRDMGIMQIDEQGVWIDDYYQSRFPAQPLNLPNTTATPVNVPAPAPADTSADGPSP